MSKGKVSVIVPIFNSEKYLDMCISSVFRQSYIDLELILVNDGSSDRSLEICHRYTEMDNRVVVISQKNKGVSAARNVGINHATGDFITFLDSDDELAENAVEFLVENVIKYGADMASAVKSLIMSDGSVYNPYENKKMYIYEGEESIKRSLLYDRQTNSVCAKLFSKELLSNVRFAEGHSINEDGYFLFQCYAKKPKVVQHNVSIYSYYIRSGSNSRGEFSEKYLDMIYFCELKKQYIMGNMPNLVELAKDMEVSTHLFFLEVLCRTTDKKYKRNEKNSICVVRKRNFKYRTINKHERKMAFIVTFGLYPLYKILYRIKFLSNN